MDHILKYCKYLDEINLEEKLLFFNVDANLGWQENTVLCGIECKGVTMDKELYDDDVIHEQLIRCLAKMFQFCVYQIEV